MTAPEALDRELTLKTALARYEELRLKEALADPDDPSGSAPLQRKEALELLALSEIIAKKAVTGRQLTIRSARAAGASWTDIGQSLGTTRQAAWESHNRWIEAQVSQRDEGLEAGFDEDDAEEARALAGLPDDYEGHEIAPNGGAASDPEAGHLEPRPSTTGFAGTGPTS